MLDIKITKTTTPAEKPEKGTQLGFGKIPQYATRPQLFEYAAYGASMQAKRQGEIRLGKMRANDATFLFHGPV